MADEQGNSSALVVDVDTGGPKSHSAVIPGYLRFLNTVTGPVLSFLSMFPYCLYAGLLFVNYLLKDSSWEGRLAAFIVVDIFSLMGKGALVYLFMKSVFDEMYTKKFWIENFHYKNFDKGSIPNNILALNGALLFGLMSIIGVEQTHDYLQTLNSSVVDDIARYGFNIYFGVACTAASIFVNYFSFRGGVHYGAWAFVKSQVYALLENPEHRKLRQQAGLPYENTRQYLKGLFQEWHRSLSVKSLSNESKRDDVQTTQSSDSVVDVEYGKRSADDPSPLKAVLIALGFDPKQIEAALQPIPVPAKGFEKNDEVVEQVATVKQSINIATQGLLAKLPTADLSPPKLKELSSPTVAHAESVRIFWSRELMLAALLAIGGAGTWNTYQLGGTVADRFNFGEVTGDVIGGGAFFSMYCLSACTVPVFTLLLMNSILQHQVPLYMMTALNMAKVIFASLAICVIGSAPLLYLAYYVGQSVFLQACAGAGSFMNEFVAVLGILVGKEHVKQHPMAQFAVALDARLAELRDGALPAVVSTSVNETMDLKVPEYRSIYYSAQSLFHSVREKICGATPEVEQPLLGAR